jgi:hypothetical protein
VSNGLFNVEWKLNKGMSALGIGSIVPDFETRLYQELPNGYSLTVTGAKNGQPYQWGYKAFYDGKEYPVYGRQDVDAITAYRLDDRNTVGFFTHNQLAGGPYSRKLSEDGKQLVVWAAGRGVTGAPYFDVLHYDA